MASRQLFPWTHALWRFLSSKPVRISLLTFTSLLVATMVAFRVESFLFQRRVHSILSRMAKIKLDNTSEQDLRSLMPELEGPDGPECEEGKVSSKIYSVLISDVDRGTLSSLVESLDRYNGPALEILYLLGHRFHRFGAYAYTCAGKVVHLEYFLWIDDNHNHNMFEGTEVKVSGYSRTGWPYSRNYSNGFIYEGATPYVEWVSSNAPKNDLAITFTTEAPADFVRAAFDLQLVCLQSFAGCTDTKELLPGIWPPRFAWRHEKF